MTAGVVYGLTSDKSVPDKPKKPPVTQNEPSKTHAVQEKPVSTSPQEADVQIRIKNGNPVGGVKQIKAVRGEKVVIRISSDVSDEIHLHGYDRSVEVAPGKSAKLQFKANIEGIFEIELEQRGIEVGSLRVSPS